MVKYKSHTSNMPIFLTAIKSKVYPQINRSRNLPIHPLMKKTGEIITHITAEYTSLKKSTYNKNNIPAKRPDTVIKTKTISL